MKNLFPADTYIVKNCTILNNEARFILTKLYQPIIGSTAINLYFTLWGNLDSSQIISTEYTHHNLMSNMRIKLDDILESREKLEAIGLLKTYIKEGNINNYIYELYSPLGPKEFIDNPILSSALESNIGKNEYKKVIKLFMVPKVDLTGYEEITSSFNSTFGVTDSLPLDTSNIRKVKQVDLIVDEKVDLNNVLSMIPEEVLNHKSITKATKSLIYKLSFVYDLSDEDLSDLIRNSINEKHIIDKKLLRENCQNYYMFEHKGKSPSLMYKKQPEYLRKSISDNSKKTKMIYTFETTTPYEFLSGKNKGIKPSKSDLSVVETLLVDYDLTPGVVNVLIDYVLRINNNKLTKNFVLTIASQWKRSNIKTVEDAMNFCRKENKTKTRSKQIKTEVKPNWYGKNIEEETASAEEIKKIEARLNSL